MIAHLKAAAAVAAAIPAWRVGRTGAFYDLALGGGLSPAQVINTLINCSSYITIKSTRRDEWGCSNLLDFLQTQIGKLNLMAGRKHFQRFLRNLDIIGLAG